MRRELYFYIAARKARLVLLASPCVALLLLLAACTSLGTHIVNTDLDVQIAGHDASGRTWQAAPGEISKQTRHPQSASPFANTVYKGKLFEWRFLADPKSLGYSVTSHVKDLCFRFDQARFTSNFQRKEIPMRVNFSDQASASKPRVWKKNAQGERPMFTPPSFCFLQNELNAVGFVVDMSELFPSGNMFNIKWEGNSTTLTDKGIGNWLKIYLPIEYEGRREELEITLTPTDSAARLAYH